MRAGDSVFGGVLFEFGNLVLEEDFSVEGEKWLSELDVEPLFEKAFSMGKDKFVSKVVRFPEVIVGVLRGTSRGEPFVEGSPDVKPNWDELSKEYGSRLVCCRE